MAITSGRWSGVCGKTAVPYNVNCAALQTFGLLFQASGPGWEAFRCFPLSLICCNVKRQLAVPYMKWNVPCVIGLQRARVSFRRPPLPSRPVKLPIKSNSPCLNRAGSHNALHKASLQALGFIPRFNDNISIKLIKRVPWR